MSQERRKQIEEIYKFCETYNISRSMVNKYIQKTKNQVSLSSLSDNNIRRIHRDRGYFSLAVEQLNE